jgi:hypothetical protein
MYNINVLKVETYKSVFLEFELSTKFPEWSLDFLGIRTLVFAQSFSEFVKHADAN